MSFFASKKTIEEVNKVFQGRSLYLNGEIWCDVAPAQIFVDSFPLRHKRFKFPELIQIPLNYLFVQDVDEMIPSMKAILEIPRQRHLGFLNWHYQLKGEGDETKMEKDWEKFHTNQFQWLREDLSYRQPNFCVYHRMENYQIDQTWTNVVNFFALCSSSPQSWMGLSELEKQSHLDLHNGNLSL